VTTSLPVSGSASVAHNLVAVFAFDPSAGDDQAKFAQELKDVDQAASFGNTPKKGLRTAIESVSSGGIKEPGEPSATCLAVMPFVPVLQQAPPITLELSFDKGAKKSANIVAAGTAIGSAEAAPEEYGAAAKPLLDAIFQQPDRAATSAVGPQPVDSGRLPTQFGAHAIPDSPAVTAGGSPEMPQPTSEELTVAVRLKAQDSQTTQTAGTASKAVPVKEPRRVDVDEPPPVQPVRDPAFQAAAWNRHEVSASAAPQARLEEPNASPEHLVAAPAPAFAEGPAKRAEPLRDLSIQLGQGNQEKVELRVSERAGEVRVAVRTADIGLQNGLRESLPELVHRLEGQGYRADAWRPSGVVSATTPLTEASQSSSDFQSGDSQTKQGWSQQERGQHDHNHSQRPQWVEELEANLAGDGNRPTGAFHGYIR